MPNQTIPIRYIRPEIPVFKPPLYGGQRYTALVPDSLDIQARAALAINALTSATDTDADYEIYWSVYLHGDRPVMHHDYNDHVQIKWQEALPLLRLASGSDRNLHIDQRWTETVLHMQGPDGLLYYPIVGRPWVNINVPVDQFGPLPTTGHYAQPYNNGRLLAAVEAYYQVTGDDLWRQVGRKMVDGLWRLAIDRGDYAFFSKGQYAPGELSDPGALIPPPMTSLPFAWTLMGLAQHFRCTGYEPAKDLATKLACYFRERARFFAADARFLPEEPENPDHPERAHLHGHCYVLLGMLELGLATGDKELINFARRGYEYAKRHGEMVTGFFPEWIDPRRRQTCEICGVADMIAVGLKLCEARAGDYWDEVDRWVRNVFAEGQCTRTDWMYRVGAGRPRAPIDETYQTDDHVAERNLGAFGSHLAPNDFFGNRRDFFAHCCLGNAARTLYYVWENILHYEEGQLRVNLLLNRASPWADVDSHIPYAGQVDVRVKAPIDLAVRIPEWVIPDQVTCHVDDRPRALGWDGRYALVGRVRSGSVATIAFPIEERSDRVYFEKEPYTLVRKGNEVVFIDPPGGVAPLYRRDHYRENETRWRKIERFVPEKIVHW